MQLPQKLFFFLSLLSFSFVPKVLHRLETSLKTPTGCRNKRVFRLGLCIPIRALEVSLFKIVLVS